MLKVSVPYWGLDFLIMGVDEIEHIRQVSVPYWGLDFLIASSKTLKSQGPMKGFACQKWNQHYFVAKTHCNYQ